MAKQRFFPDNLEGQILWIINFDLNLPTYATKYGISPAQLTSVSNDRNWINYWFEQQNLNQVYAQSLTAFRNEAAYGLPSGAEPSVPPVPPAAGTVPTAVEPGVFKRCLAIANAIKVHVNYTVADGEALGIEGATIIPPNINDARPVLKLTAAGETVEIGWGKQKFAVDGLEIHVKRGAAAYVYLATDTTTPKYVDTYPLPVATEAWTYKAIYVKAGARVGLWSEEVTISVKA
jgi:hypothetical protein